jgi:hypothetical protein
MNQDALDRINKAKLENALNKLYCWNGITMSTRDFLASIDIINKKVTKSKSGRNEYNVVYNTMVTTDTLNSVSGEWELKTSEHEVFIQVLKVVYDSIQIEGINSIFHKGGTNA